MNIDATFLPVAVELIDQVFPTDVVFKRHNEAHYDPLTGTVGYGLPTLPGVLADFTAEVTCVPAAIGDYAVSDIGDGVTSICDDPTLPAGTAEYDNADITPRSDIKTSDQYEDVAIKAGVLSRKRVEEGGPSEVYEIALWVHHGTTGLPFLPTTEDSLTYDSVLWRVTQVDPTYSSTSLIASKITARSA